MTLAAASASGSAVGERGGGGAKHWRHYASAPTFNVNTCTRTSTPPAQIHCVEGRECLWKISSPSSPPPPLGNKVVLFLVPSLQTILYDWLPKSPSCSSLRRGCFIVPPSLSRRDLHLPFLRHHLQGFGIYLFLIYLFIYYHTMNTDAFELALSKYVLPLSWLCQRRFCGSRRT